MNDLDEIVRRLRIERAWILLGIDQMGPNVFLDHFSHQTGDASAYAGDHVLDAFGRPPLSRPGAAAPCRRKGRKRARRVQGDLAYL
jgi:hypothetical protein